MPVETTPEGTTVITGNSIEEYRLRVIYRGLQLQAKTGMRVSHTSLVAVARRMGYNGRTAKQLVADMQRRHPDKFQPNS